MSKGTDWAKVRTITFGVLAGVISTAGTLAVTVAGFALSYDAIRAVGRAAHMRPGWSWLLPVSIDGAMAVATIVAVVLRRMTGRSAFYPWFVVSAGAAISIGCNGLHAMPDSIDGQLVIDQAEIRFGVSAIPAVMLTLSVHLLITLIVAASGIEKSSASTAVVVDGADDDRTTPVVDAPNGGEDLGPALVDPWSFSTPSAPSVRPSAGPSAIVDDRPRRLPSAEMDRVWANFAGEQPPKFRQFPSAPSAPSAGPSAHVAPLPGAGKTDIDAEPADDGDDLLDGARTVADDLARQGVSVSRDNLARAMRDAGFTVSNDRASALVRKLRTVDGRADGPRTVNGKKPTFIDR